MKSEIIRIRATVQEKKSWSRAAGAEKTTMSEWVRQRLNSLSATTTIADQIKAGLKEFSKQLKSGKPIKATRVHKDSRREKITLRCKKKPRKRTT